MSGPDRHAAWRGGPASAPLAPGASAAARHLAGTRLVWMTGGPGPAWRRAFPTIARLASAENLKISGHLAWLTLKAGVRTGFLGLAVNVGLPLAAALPVYGALGFLAGRSWGQLGLALDEQARRARGRPLPANFTGLSPARQRLERFFASRRYLAHANAGRGRSFFQRPAFQVMAGAALVSLLFVKSFATPGVEGLATLRIAQESHPSAASRALSEMSDRFSAVRPGTSVVFVDDDALSLTEGLDRELGLSRSQMKRISDFVAARTGRTVSAFSAVLLSGHVESGRAHAQSAGLGSGVCVVAATPPDHAVEHDIGDRIAFLQQFYEGVGESQLKAPMSRDEYWRYVHYHEAFHCLDQTFWPAAARHPAVFDSAGSALHRHRAEVFADTAAALLMAAEGHGRIAGQLADMGELLSARGAPLLVREGTGWDSHSAAIYYSAPALHAAQAFIDHAGPEALARMGVDALLQKAAALTEGHGLSPDQFAALEDFHQKLADANRGARLDGHEPLAAGADPIVALNLARARAAQGRLFSGAPAPVAAAPLPDIDQALAGAAGAEFASRVGTLRDKLRQALDRDGADADAITARLRQLRERARLGPKPG